MNPVPSSITLNLCVSPRIRRCCLTFILSPYIILTFSNEQRQVDHIPSAINRYIHLFHSYVVATTTENDQMSCLLFILPLNHYFLTNTSSGKEEHFHRLNKKRESLKERETCMFSKEINDPPSSCRTNDFNHQPIAYLQELRVCSPVQCLQLQS